MKGFDDTPTVFLRAGPAARLRLIFAIYKRYFSSSYFSWVVLVHAIIVSCACMLSMQFLAHFHGSPFELKYAVMGGALSGASLAVHAKLLNKYLFLKYSTHFQSESEES